MNKQLRSIRLTVMMCLALTAAQAAPPAWSPNEALVVKLAPATLAGGYQIQPPAGFQFSRPNPRDTHLQVWRKTPRPDGTRPYLLFGVIHPTTAAEKRQTLRQFFDHMETEARRWQANRKQTAPEAGTIHGMPFLRAYRSGKDTLTGQARRGFTYVGQDGKVFLFFSSQDGASHAKTTLPVLEASVQTIRKH